MKILFKFCTDKVLMISRSCSVPLQYAADFLFPSFKRRICQGKQSLVYLDREIIKASDKSLQTWKFISAGNMFRYFFLLRPYSLQRGIMHKKLNFCSLQLYFLDFLKNIIILAHDWYFTNFIQLKRFNQTCSFLSFQQFSKELLIYHRSSFRTIVQGPSSTCRKLLIA